MILDLNVTSFAKSLVQKKLLQEGSDGGQMADSESSNSSVLNAEDSSNIFDEDEASIRPTFRFGILKNASVSEEEVEEIRVTSESRLVTHQLFPQQPQGISEWHPLSRKTWEDFNDFHADVPAAEEVTLLHPQKQQLQVKKSRRGPRSRSSAYRGVTFYRRTGRWESHIWDCGKQVYLGGFNTAHDAARAYDQAAIKFRGLDADINFSVSDYEEDLKQMRNLTKEEFVHILRRRSTGLSRGNSKYSGLTRHKFGSWEARMGQFLSKKRHKTLRKSVFTIENTMLPCRVHDKAAIIFKGKEAVTNFQQHTHEGDLPKDDGEDFRHGIDLNLSISQPGVCSPKGNVNMVDQLSYYGSFQASDHIKQMLSFDLPCVPIVSAHPLAVTPDHPKAWSNIHLGFFPVMEERAMNKKAETGLTALKSFPAWKFHGFSPVSPHSCAASSGFSTASSTIVGNSYTQPPQLPLATNPYLLQICSRPLATGHYFPSRDPTHPAT